MVKTSQARPATTASILTIPGRAIRTPGGLVRTSLSLLIVAALGVTAFCRNEVWQNEMLLYEDAVRKSPNKGRPHHNLGRAYDRKGFLFEAYGQYLQAVSADPELAKAHEALGMFYVARGQYSLARQELELALRLEPGLLESAVFLSYIDEQEKVRSR